MRRKILRPLRRSALFPRPLMHLSSALWFGSESSFERMPSSKQRELKRRKAREMELFWAKRSTKFAPVTGIRGSDEQKNHRYAVFGMQRGKDVVAYLRGELLKGECTLDSSVFGAAIKRCWNQLGDFSSALHCFELGRDCDILTHVQYCIFLNACAEAQRNTLAFGIYDGLRKAESKRQSENKAPLLCGITYATLVKCCQSKGSVKRALHFVEKAKSHDLVPKQHLLCSFLKVCAKASNLEAAKRAFYDFLELDEFTTANALSAEMDTGNGVVSVNSERIVRRSIIDAPVFNAMLQVCLQCGDLDYALELDELREAKSIPRTHVFPLTFGLLHFGKGDYGAAVNLLEAANRMAPKCSREVCHSLLTAYIQLMLGTLERDCGDAFADAGNEIHNGANENDTNVNARRSELLRKMERLLQQMEENKVRIGFRTNQQILAARLAHCFPRWQPVVRRLEALMEADGFDIWFHHSNAFDFSEFTPEIARFLLRYIFSFYSRRQLVKAFGKGKCEVEIVCAKRWQRKHHSVAVKRVVRDELLSWQPPIRSRVDPKNIKALICDGDDVVAFFKRWPPKCLDFVSTSVFATCNQRLPCDT